MIRTKGANVAVREIDRTRRKLLKYSGGVFAASVFLPVNGAAAVRLTAPGELTKLSAVDAVTRMRSGDLDAETYAAALLGRAREKRELNAFISLDPEKLLAAARAADLRRAKGETIGTLHGLPIPVKDSVFTEDYPTTAGTAALRKLNHRVDAPLVARLKANGAMVMGKTNLHELSTGHTSNNEIFGAVHNPFDPTRIPGGSSGGTAVAVATGMAPLGIAEDTFGSIRVPAALCGVAGFRPTTGRYPSDGVVPLTPRFDQLGPIARRVADIILFDRVMTGSSYRDTGPTLDSVRLGVPRGYFYNGMATETQAVIDAALKRLEGTGVTLVEADIPDVKDLIEQFYFPVLNYEVYPTLDTFLRKAGIPGGLAEVLMQAGPRMRAFYNNALVPGAADAVSRRAYENALGTGERLRTVVGDYFSQHALDAMVFPSTLSAAIPIGDENETELDGRRVPTIVAIGNNQALAPACGLPALTLPAGLTRSGLPVGIEFTAAPAMDEKLLTLGLKLEAALGPLPKTALN